jgi:hypothetical protein
MPEYPRIEYAPRGIYIEVTKGREREKNLKVDTRVEREFEVRPTFETSR